MKRWTSVRADPLDPIVMQERLGVINAARRPPVRDRLEYLRGLAAGKSVLDVGIVDHVLDQRQDWLHGAIAEVASHCLGVDILDHGIEELRARGYNVAALDITAGELPSESFDLVMAGEVVEHLGNPGGLFSAASEVLNDGGRLVLTTPNPYAPWRVSQYMRGRPEENVDHVTLIAPWGMVEFASRAQLRLDTFRGIESRPVGWKAKLSQQLVHSRVLPLPSETACNSIIYEFTRP